MPRFKDCCLETSPIPILAFENVAHLCVSKQNHVNVWVDIFSIRIFKTKNEAEKKKHWLST